MTLTSKFKKDVQTLRSASNGDFYLDVKNPKLYKKKRGVVEKYNSAFGTQRRGGSTFHSDQTLSQSSHLT